jgi:hypothetical protein
MPATPAWGNQASRIGLDSRLVWLLVQALTMSVEAKITKVTFTKVHDPIFAPIEFLVDIERRTAPLLVPGLVEGRRGSWPSHHSHGFEAIK